MTQIWEWLWYWRPKVVPRHAPGYARHVKILTSVSSVGNRNAISDSCKLSTLGFDVSIGRHLVVSDACSWYHVVADFESEGIFCLTHTVPGTFASWNIDGATITPIKNTAIWAAIKKPTVMISFLRDHDCKAVLNAGFILAMSKK